MINEGRVLSVHHQLFLADVLAEGLKCDQEHLLNKLFEAGIALKPDETELISDAKKIFENNYFKKALEIDKKQKMKLVKND